MKRFNDCTGLGPMLLGALLFACGEPSDADPVAAELARVGEAIEVCPIPNGVRSVTPATPRAPCRANQYSVQMLVYAAGDSHSLDLYRPNGATGALPTVIWVHGGGWQGGSKMNINQPSALLCAGYAVASIDYRLTPTGARFPDPVHDVKAAIRYLRANAASLGLDPNRFALFGSSAGGHLAAVAGLSTDVAALEGTLGNPSTSSAVQAIVDWYGPTSFSTMDAELAAQGCRPSNPAHGASDSAEGMLLGCAPSDASCSRRVREASPMTYADADDPPMLIMHGAAATPTAVPPGDCTVPLQQSRRLYNRLAGTGACVGMREVQGAGHGGSEWLTQEVFDQVRAFLDGSVGQ